MEFIKEGAPYTIDDIAVIVPVKDCLKQTEAFFQSIMQVEPRPTCLVIIDDDSGPDTRAALDLISQNERIHLERLDDSDGVAQLWNIGISKAMNLGKRLFVICNNDIVFHKETFKHILDDIANDSMALYCAIDGNSGGTDKSKEWDKPIEDIEIADRDGGFYCFYMTEKLVDEVGNFDQRFRRAYFEDNDYVIRMLEKGFKKVCSERAIVFHEGSTYIKSIEGTPQRLLYHDAYARNRRRLLVKHGTERVKNAFGDVEYDRLGFPPVAEQLMLERMALTQDGVSRANSAEIIIQQRLKNG